MNKIAEALLYFWRGVIIVIMCLFFIGLSETEFPFASLLGVGLSGLLCYWLAKKSGSDRNWAILYGASMGLIAWIYYIVIWSQEDARNKEFESQHIKDEHIRAEILSDQEPDPDQDVEE